MSGLPISSMMKGWFSGLLKATFRSKEIVSLWVLAAIGDGSRGGALISVINRVVFTAITCILALGMFITLDFIGFLLCLSFERVTQNLAYLLRTQSHL